MLGSLRSHLPGPGRAARRPGRRTASPSADRELLAVRFCHDDLASIRATPQELAHRWGGLLLSQDQRCLTVLLAPPPEDVDEVQLLLAAMGPDALWRSPGIAGHGWHLVTTAPPPRQDLPVASA